MTSTQEKMLRAVLDDLKIIVINETLEAAALHFGNTGDLKTHQEIARELRAMKGTQP
jgi:NAD(P)H-dependent FMN reductase